MAIYHSEKHNIIRYLTITLLLSSLTQLSYGQDYSFNCDSIPASMFQRFTKQFPTDDIIQNDILSGLLVIWNS